MALTLPGDARRALVSVDAGAVGRSSTVITPPAEPHAVPKTGSPEPRAMWQRRYGRYLQITDLVVATSAVALAELLRFGSTSANLTSHKSLDYSVVSILIIGTWVWFLAICRTRAPGVIGAGSEEFRRVWTATLSVFGAIAIVSMLFKLDIARGYLAIALPVGLLGLSVNRLLARKYVAAQRRRGRFMTAVLAVGEPKSVTALAQSLAQHPADGYTVVGVCTRGAPQRES